MKFLPIVGLAVATLLLNACSNKLDMPKGTSKGYSAARLVARDSKSEPITDAKEKKVHSLVQRSLKAQFEGRGMTFNKPGADLIVAYLVLYQDNIMTTSLNEYYGAYREESDLIPQLAHEKGVIDQDSPDYFERAGLVVDVFDARTNKLIYRNYTVANLIKNVSEQTRAKRVNDAVNKALAPFFKDRS